MVKVLKNKVMIAVVLLLMLFPHLVVFSASAQTSDDAKSAVCKGIGNITGADGCEADPDDAEVDSTLQTVINILTFIGAVIAVIMIIIGGIKYVTSSGDSSSTASARNTIIYALVGLVIIAMSQLLVRFVASRIDDPSGGNSSVNVDVPCSPQQAAEGLCVPL